MKDSQWQTLVAATRGEPARSTPGFIVDCPWLPNWYGVSILDYLASDEIWFEANRSALETFPGAMFLPGFWSEFGMCSEPSAFGAKCSFPKNEFPHAHKTILSPEEISRIPKPNPHTDGLGPLILNRLLLNRERIEKSGHRIYFSVSRGPLNIATYLMGTTEFLTGMITHPEEIHRLLNTINDYLISWHEIQKEAFPTIEGMLVLDDIIGFIGEEEFREFGLPYLKALFDRKLKVKFLHNDASCKSSINYLDDIGVNLFNMGYDTDLNELKEQTGERVTMMGNIPPRDVLANGSPVEIETEVKNLLSNLKAGKRVLVSCGGGMPPGATTGNINQFIRAVNKYS